MNRSRHIVVCGAGVVGICVAWYLVARGHRVTIVDRVGPAAASSGHAGGFLARNWCDGTLLEPMCHLSYTLHNELAEELNGENYGFRSMTALSVALPLEHRGLITNHNGSRDWLSENCFFRGELGGPPDTAQVHPGLFTRTLFDRLLKEGVRFVRGTVHDVVRSHTDAVGGVRVDDEVIDAGQVVMAMGPWTNDIPDGKFVDEIDGIKSDSIVLRPEKPLPAHALFIDCETEDGEWQSPELFTRPDGSVYVCGQSNNDPLPESADAVEPSAHGAENLLAMAARISPALAGLKPEVVNACYRPSSLDGLPRVGQVRAVRGLWVATGHGPWGILNAPATGLAMAELISEGTSKSLDLRPYAP